ncbi:MAG TPA: hypothetical protein PKA10_03900 [Selenomonadales bacterium]|nr:hypothetical protein [Selenomonadales bacterium]
MSACFMIYNWNGRFKWLEVTGYGYYLVDPGYLDEFRRTYRDARLVPLNATDF